MLDEQNISDTEVQGDQQSQDQQQPPKKGKPKFDPNKPFTEVLSSKPAFDPNKPFEEVKKKRQGSGFYKYFTKYSIGFRSPITISRRK